MIFENIEHYFVTDIKFSKEQFDLYVPDYMLSEYTDEQLQTAVRSYMFYYLEPDYKFTKLDVGNAINLNPTYVEQSFNADDADAIHEAVKEQIGSLIRDVTIRTRNNFIVPFDDNCTKYVHDAEKHNEIIEQEIFEHLMWSLPVFVYFPVKLIID